MNTIKSWLFGLFIVCLILSSCKKEKEEEPLIEPFLVITEVQEVEPALFMVEANVEESGSLPILEHGFLFSDQPTLYYSGDQLFQSDGSPGDEFETTFEKILTKGSNYYLQAFVRTQNGITYSPVYKFEGGDPPNFQYLGSSFPDLVYFGDTVTVKGKFLPQSLDSMNVKFNLINAELFNLTDSSFSYAIPTDVPFGGNYKIDGFSMKLRINKAHSEIFHKFRFRTAEFPEYTEVSMAGIWELPGKYLYGHYPLVQAIDETELYGDYILHKIEDELISFSPRFVLNSNEPALGIFIRDSMYVTRHVKIRTAEFAPGQKRTISAANETISVDARDFNAFVKEGNQLIIEEPGLIFTNIKQASAESISFTFNLAAPIKSRKFNLYGYNHGVKGEIPLEITYNLPAFPISYIDASTDEVLIDDAIGFSYGKEMHIITYSASYIYDVAAQNPSGKGEAYHSFYQPSVFRAFLNGKFYYSNQPIHENEVNSTALFAYDPTTGLSSSTGYLPISGRIKGSFVSGDRIFYEVGYSVGYEYVENLWAWNGVYNSEWELIKTDTLPEPDLFDVGKNFTWQDYNYRFIQFYDVEKESVMDKLERFNPQTNKWDYIQSFSSGFDNSFRAFPSSSGVYLTNGEQFYLFNPTSLTVKYMGRTNDYGVIVQSLVYADNKFYYVNKDGNALIYELDISLLKP